MRLSRASAFLFILVLFAQFTFAQQTTTSSPQAVSILQNSLAALTGGQSVTDVTLTGTARRIAGSDDESGSATLKALASGAARADLSLSSGSRSEIENLNVVAGLQTGAVSSPAPAGSWSGPDGVSHAVAFHNLLNERSWFFPAFAIGRRLANSNYVATYIGHETRNGQPVEHVSVSQTAPFADASGATLVAHLSQVDFFLDSTTFLPAAIAFNIHPDNNALLDIPVEVDFSGYQAVSGRQIPFHIQKFLNNSLLLDLQIQNATLNSGLSATLFNVQ